ncbi:MAG: chemotaxis protein CheA [Fibrobacter sp.]|nr:chemotaxis protein CheA [Fibrobacter sp.]
MNNNDEVALDLIEQITSAILIANLADPQECIEIYKLLEELEKVCTEPDCCKMTRNCLEMLEKHILNEGTDETINEMMFVLSGEKRLLVKKINCAGQGENDRVIEKKTDMEIHDSGSGLPDELVFDLNDEIVKNFIARQFGVLEELEEHILLLEKGGTVDPLKRIFHTLKGESGMVQLNDISVLCHCVEDYIEEGKRSIDDLLYVKDWLYRHFASLRDNQVHEENVQEVIKKLKKTATNISEPQQNKYEKSIDNNRLSSDISLLSDFITEAMEHLQNADNLLLELENNPMDDELLNSLFRVFHTIKGIAGFLSLEGIQTLSHITEELLDKTRKKRNPLQHDEIESVFCSIDTLKLEIKQLQTGIENGTTYTVHEKTQKLISYMECLTKKSDKNRPERIGEILQNSGKVNEKQICSALKKQVEHPEKKLGEIFVENGLVSEKDIDEVLGKQGKSAPKVAVRETIKVDTEKLDKLVDMIGELVIAEAMVTGDKEVVERASTRALRNMRQLDKITRQLQEVSLSMRLVSLKSTFQKMARLVRDLSKKSGKNIEFVTCGEDTELDKSVIENIGDPLVHMIRNSTDHGIEPDDERKKAGKTQRGRIELRAFQTGGSICIEIEDNGRGLDKDAIRAKAISLGLMEETDNLSDKEIHSLIFQPGFSTAIKVTDVSGRGVGMDVVQKNIQNLRGSIDIKTEKGKGTVFSIYLPLTMAIMDGMVVMADRERYIIPTSAIVESMKFKKEEITSVTNKGEMVDFRDNLIPLVYLCEILERKIDNKIDDDKIIMVIEDMDRRCGLVIDSIIGQQQTVIKRLGEGIGSISGISGGAIMSDGNVSLIIDVGGILRNTKQYKT